MTNFYEPMSVEIIENPDRSTHPEPALNPEWSFIDRLRWHAGVVKAREGIVIRFNDGSSYSDGQGGHWEWPLLIGLNVGDTSSSVTADEAWAAVNHIELGARAARLKAEAETA